MNVAEPRTVTWDRETYYRLAEQGYFQGRRVQLIEGEIIEMSPQKHPHYAAIELLGRALANAFGDGWWIREQAPLRMPNNSEPEPDLAVVPGSPKDYTDHPTTANLVVEVADWSLTFDKTRKLRLYAAANIPEYWIVDLKKRRLLVFRDSVPQDKKYAESIILTDEDSVSPLDAPHAVIQVAAILP